MTDAERLIEIEHELVILHQRMYEDRQRESALANERNQLEYLKYLATIDGARAAAQEGTDHHDPARN
jgi:hypothetical protein